MGLTETECFFWCRAHWQCPTMPHLSTPVVKNRLSIWNVSFVALKERNCIVTNKIAANQLDRTENSDASQKLTQRQKQKGKKKAVLETTCCDCAKSIYGLIPWPLWQGSHFVVQTKIVSRTSPSHLDQGPPPPHWRSPKAIYGQYTVHIYLMSHLDLGQRGIDFAPQLPQHCFWFLAAMQFCAFSTYVNVFKGAATENNAIGTLDFNRAR